MSRRTLLIVPECTAFIHTWKEMILMRVLLGVAMVSLLLCVS